MVRFCFAPKVPSVMKAAFLEATRHIKSQVPCLAFNHVVRKSNFACAEFPSVLVSSHPGGCWSHFGQVSQRHAPYVGSSQRLNLGPGCDSVGMAVHQLVSTLGVGRESSRIDRDDFVTIGKEQNTLQAIGQVFPLNSAPPTREAYDGHTFDLLSITMPHSRAFSSNGKVTLEPKGDPRLHRYAGQRMGLSQLDVERIAERFGCGEHARPAEPSAFLSSQLLLGKGLQPTCRDREYT